MRLAIPLYRDLDGWDALLFLVGAVATPVALLAAHLGLSPEVLGTSSVVGGILPFGVRRALWPRSVKSESRHTVVTLLLLAIGGFVTLIGLGFAFLLASMLRDPKVTAADAPPVLFLVPLGVIAIGVGMMGAGKRLARVR